MWIYGNWMLWKVEHGIWIGVDPSMEMWSCADGILSIDGHALHFDGAGSVMFSKSMPITRKRCGEARGNGGGQRVCERNSMYIFCQGVCRELRIGLWRKY